MTPLQIVMMLHYYAIAEPYAYRDPCHANSEAVRKQRDRLVSFELIEPDPNSRSGYRATERGVAYVEALERTPLPIKKWVMPLTGAE